MLVAAALVRLPTLDVQSFGDFETYTVVLERMDLGSMLSKIPEFEGTPPLYYLLSWFWAQAFGTGEVGLRLLPALLSVGTVGLTYLIGRALAGARVGLVAAALMALNPLAVWYSQEARAYALLMFLTALGLWFFARLVRAEGDRTRNLVGWSAASALALLTHYFAALVILPEAVWLLAVAVSRRAVVVAAMPPLVTGAGLIGLLLDQREHAGGGEPEATALGTRIAQVPKQFLVGFNVPLEIPLTAAGIALVLVAVWLALTRAGPTARRGARVAAVIAAAGAASLLVLALAGFDYLLTRYLTVILVPCAVVLAAGFATSRGGLAAAGALGAVFIAALIGVEVDPQAQRPDLRGALEPLGDAPGGRALFIPTNTRVDAYLPHARLMPQEGRTVGEAVVVGLVVVGSESRDEPDVAFRPPGPFRPVERVETDSYSRERFRPAHPLKVSTLALLGNRSGLPLWLFYQP